MNIRVLNPLTFILYIESYYSILFAFCQVFFVTYATYFSRLCCSVDVGSLAVQSMSLGYLFNSRLRGYRITI